MYNPCSFRDFQKSLLAYFKNKKEFFSVNCSNEAKTSLSLPDHSSNKEWILSVFENQNVYRYNIYDKYFDDNNNLQFNNETEENLIKFLKMYNLKVDNF